MAHQSAANVQVPAPYLFATYSHADADAVQADVTALQARGINIWWDDRLQVGSTWLNELAERIEASAGVLLFASPSALTSRYCEQEINFAISRGRPVLTTFVEPATLPPGFAMALGSRQMIQRPNPVNGHYINQLALAAGELLRPADRRARSVDYASIAILKFENLSSDADNAHLAAGIAEELVLALGNIDGIRVASRTSSFAIGDSATDIRQIGQQLNVAWVLEGSVRRAGNRLRISTRLTEAHTGVQAWAERHDRELADLFELQDDVAASVLQAVLRQFDRPTGSRLLEVGTSDVEAYSAYLAGRHETFKLTPAALEFAIARLRHAVALDPDFLRARVALLTALDGLRMSFGRTDLQPQIDAERDELRRRDPDGRVLNWRAYDQLQGTGGRDALEALERLFSAMLTDPQHPGRSGMNPDRWWAGGFGVDDDRNDSIDGYAQYGLLLAQAGLYRTALAYMGAGNLLSSARALVEIILDDLEAARETITRCMQAEPHVFVHHAVYNSLLGRLGDHAAADQHLEQMRALMNAEMTDSTLLTQAYWRDDVELLARTSEHVDKRQLTRLFLGISRVPTDIDRALDHFTASVNGGEAHVRAIRVWVPGFLKHDDWQRLLARTDFNDLLQRIGVDAGWQQAMRDSAARLAPTTGIEIAD